MKKSIIALVISALFLFVSIIPALAAADENHPARVVDEAELLDDFDEGELLTMLDEISERQQCDVAVLTSNSLEGKSAMDYADDYFDYNGYGLGENRDGIMLVICMEERDWYITTRGYGITAITDAGLDYMSEQFLGDLSNGNYAAAFTTFATLCDSMISSAKEGAPVDIPEDSADVGNYTKEPFEVGRNLIISIFAGFIFALIVTCIMLSKLKSVRQQNAASNYVRPNSLVLTQSNDFFLYKNVSKTPIPKNTTSSGGGGSSGGGSSTHTSSSGATHGGGGGKF